MYITRYFDIKRLTEIADMSGSPKCHLGLTDQRFLALQKADRQYLNPRSASLKVDFTTLPLVDPMQGLATTVSQRLVRSQTNFGEKSIQGLYRYLSHLVQQVKKATPTIPPQAEGSPILPDTQERITYSLP